jgi:hypothetical protein
MMSVIAGTAPDGTMLSVIVKSKEHSDGVAEP